MTAMMRPQKGYQQGLQARSAAGPTFRLRSAQWPSYGHRIAPAAVTPLPDRDVTPGGVGRRAANGDEILLAPYYGASGRIEQDFVHLVQSQSAVAVPATAICQAEACCAR